MAIAMDPSRIDWRHPDREDEELDRQVVDFTQTRYREGKERRAGWEVRAREQLRYVEGDQSSTEEVAADLEDKVREELRRDVRPLPFSHQHPVQVNVLKGIVVQRIALMLGELLPQLVAVPPTTEDQDINAAQVGTKLLYYTWSNGPCPVSRDFLHALWILYITGVQFIHPCWDPGLGPTDRFPPKSGESADDFRKRIAEMTGQDPAAVQLDGDGAIHLPAGSVRWKFRTGFDITEPPFALDVKECDWLIDSDWVSREALLDQYGDEVQEIPEGADADEFDERARRFYGPRRRQEQTGEDRGMILRHTLWRPVRPYCPEGFHAVVAGGKLLRRGRHPYVWEHQEQRYGGELPFYRMVELPAPQFRPWSSVHSLMPLTKSRNRLRSQIAAHVDETVAPKAVVNDPGIKDDFLDTESRVCRPRNPNHPRPAYFLTPAPMRGDVFRLDEMYRRDSQDVGAVHDSTMGRGESGSQSGRHAAIVQRGDAREQTITRKLVEAAVGDAGRQTLWLWWRFAKSERMLEVTGPDYWTEVFTFKAEDLVGRKSTPAPAHFNVVVELQGQKTLADIAQFVDFMLTRKLWDPVRDRQRIERLFSQFTPGDYDEAGRHRREVRLEHEAFKQGKEIQAVMGDAHDTHIEDHLAWMATGDFRRAMQQEKPRKPREEGDQRIPMDLASRLTRHVKEHYRWRAQMELLPELYRELEKQALLDELGPGEDLQAQSEARQILQALRQRQGAQGSGNGQTGPRVAGAA